MNFRKTVDVCDIGKALQFDGGFDGAEGMRNLRPFSKSNISERDRDSHIKKTQQQLLNARIKGCFSNIRFLTKTIKGLFFLISQKVPPEEFANHITRITSDIKAREKITLLRHQKKLLFWQKKYSFPLPSSYNQKQQSSNVINLYNRTLSPSEILLLETGLKFRIPSKPNIPEVISSIESTIKQYSLKDKYFIRTIITKILTKLYTPTPNYCADLRILKSLKQSKSVVITRSDKGSNTVIMNQEDYRTKMHSLLNDDTTFSPISDEVSLSLVKVFRTSLLQLKKSKDITPNDYRSFISNLSNSAYIYVLPKIHKPDVPLRPIIAYHLSLAYPLAKFLSNYLSPLLNNHRIYTLYVVPPPPHFISELTAMNPAPHFTMCSFDVTSLYLSLPHSLITDSLERFLSSQNVDPIQLLLYHN
ncbi:hypothetical protein LAZ67_4002853 [Cordylochernes scorpioides]|uniref:Reverse transcriptase domain-containing protein n=1 Tax=Cordylochernes scorpioides TaxID=51811 RepID=A0ABY6KDD7_9ARAC|nr:hypothetical protein LAZ67_4002853 [Cordylochernes scorpioides]